MDVFHRAWRIGALFAGALAAGATPSIAQTVSEPSDRIVGPVDCAVAARQNACFVKAYTGSSVRSAEIVRDGDSQSVTPREMVRASSRDAEDFGYREVTFVLFDRSVGVGRARVRYEEETRAVAADAVDALGASGASRFFIAAFDDDTDIVADDVGPSSAVRAVERLALDGQTTFLYSQVIDAARRLAEEEATIKRVLVISDGLAEDTAARDVTAAIDEALALGVTVDTVGVFWSREGQNDRIRGKDILRSLARDTGGYFAEVDFTEGETLRDTGYTRAVEARRDDSLFIPIDEDADTATVQVRLRYSDDAARIYGGETVFAAAYFRGCPAGETGAQCAARISSGEVGTTEINNEPPNEGPAISPAMLLVSGVAVVALLVGLALLLYSRRGGGDEIELDSEDSWGVSGAPRSGPGAPAPSGPAPQAAGVAQTPQPAPQPAPPPPGPRAAPTVAAAGVVGDASATVLSGGRRAQLVRVDGGDAPFIIRGARVRIGRDESNDLILDHETVSRRHAEISLDRDGKGFVFTNLSETNPSEVNGKRVGTTPLRTGDVIAIGDVRLRYEEDGGR